MGRRLSPAKAALLQHILMRRRPELLAFLSSPLARLSQDARNELAHVVADEMLEQGLTHAEPGEGSVLSEYGLRLDDLIGVLAYQDE